MNTGAPARLTQGDIMAVRRLQDPATGEWFDVEVTDDIDGEAEPTPPAKTPAQYAAERSERRATNTEKIKQQDKLIAFLKAGMNPDDSPLQSDFYKAYEGDLTVEAVKAAAQARGFVEKPDNTPPQPTSQSTVQGADQGRPPTPQELAYMQAQAAGRIAQASQGADGSYASDMDRLRAAQASGDPNAALEVLRQAGIPILHDGTVIN